MPRPQRHRRRSPSRQTQRSAEVAIDAIAAGGEGVGRLPDGRAVFVHRTAPGDLVSVQISTERPRWARGRLLEVLEASPLRREAPCPHYEECGGCTVEHLTYDAQLTVKSGIVRDALARIGGISVDPPRVVPSPREFRYRNRVSFALRRLPTGGFVAGFHALHEADRIVPVDGGCLLPEQPIADVWDRLRRNWGPNAELLPSGPNLRLTLRSTAAGAVSLLIEGGNPDGQLEELVALTDGLEAIWHRPANEVALRAAGAPGLPEEWGGATFEVSGSAFLQVNRGAAELLEEYVVDQCGVVTGLRVIDAYCGIGLHARRLSGRGANVVGIELDAEAIHIADALTRREAADRGEADGASEFVCGRVEDGIAEQLPADLVILNPPRAGVAADVVELLLERPPPRIIYVSCDPATLARDLKGLSAIYAITAIRCFDLFPQTAHVETVVTLAKKD